MNVRMMTLGSAAAAALLFCALPASAQMSGYNHHSNMSERDQTDALNAAAADRARDHNANDRDRNRDNDRDMHDDRGMGHDRWRDDGRSGSVISINFGEIAFGYSDGYWDTGHRWHAWRNASDARGYRNHHGANFHNWRHDRDGHTGWRSNR